MDENKQTVAWHLAMSWLHNTECDERALACYNALPLCDQLDIDRRAKVIYSIHKANANSTRDNIFITIFSIVFCGGVFALLWFFLFHCSWL